MFKFSSRFTFQMSAASGVLFLFGAIGANSASAQIPPRASGAEGSLRLTATVNAPGIHQDLRAWEMPELARLKRSIAREKDPRTGKVVKSEGFLLSQFVEEILEKLPIESRAQIDLIVLKGANGQQALVPRALMIKYPLLVAIHSDQLSRQVHGPLSIVVPWTSRPKIQNEELPLESFFVSGLNQVELTNYRHQFGGLFLKRRTDPKAMRGEKLFVQSCAGCHESGRSQSPFSIGQVGQAKHFVEKGHPAGGFGFHMNERDRGAILRYAEMLQSERQGHVTQVEQPNQRTKDL
jgi:hypothetical protein